MAEQVESPGIRGWLHRPGGTPAAAVALTHGAGGDCNAALLVALAGEFASRGWLCLRYDLPYRQARPKGGPAGNSARDRAGIRAVADWLRSQFVGIPIYLGGQSYGGRQTTMLAAEDPVADALLLLSYPLHPPGQPEKLRTEHFPTLRVPSLFVHGTRDTFGSIAELEQALTLIPSRQELLVIEGAPHGVPAKHASRIADGFVTFTNK